MKTPTSKQRAKTSTEPRPGQVKRREQLTIRDRLSRLTFTEAYKLLGPNGAKLLSRHANGWQFKLREDVYLGADLFRLRFRGVGGELEAVVTITLMAEARQRLHLRCNKCRRVCEHCGAALSLILEEKTALGLAAPLKPREPVASLDEPALIKLALEERKQHSL